MTLVDVARRLSVNDLRSLMKISEKLAVLNRDRFQAFQTPFTQDNAKPAVHTFAGDTYIGLNAASMDEEDLEFAQGSVAILSGLYGLLRPMDLVQPYRLEMGSRLKNPKGKGLYDFWGQQLSEAINHLTEEHADTTVINCASNEYSKAVVRSVLNGDVITPVFKERRGDTLKVIGLFAKRARGMMARHIVDHRLQHPEQIKDFSSGGYCYQPDLSSDREWVFVR